MFHQDIPDGDDMTDAACKDEEMEHGVHVFLLIQRIEDGTRDVTDSLGNQPDDGCRRDGVHQRFEGHEHTQAHANETKGL